MREDLRGIAEDDYWVYGLSEEDFEYTLGIADGLSAARLQALHLEADQTRRERLEHAEDILDDVFYYSWVHEQYLWHFCLWRLQAILEGLITHTFLLPPRRLIGLASKLDALRDDGYVVTDAEYDTLLAWGRLRNALSHAPPEQYRPGPLNRDDVAEFSALCVGLVRRWGAHREARETNGPA